MKLIHCADLHLDSKMTANLNKEKARERKKELLLTFQRMVQYAEEHQVQGILIAGDLFDTRNISATARHGVMDAVINHPEIQFFYLKGNHDTDHFLEEMDVLPENLKLFEDSWTSYAISDDIDTEDKGEKKRVVITGMELSEVNGGSACHSLVLRSEDFNIVMLHGQEIETTIKDRAEMIPLRQLRNRGIDYLALGHVHSYKEAPLDGRGTYCYSGCLEGRGFDECGEHGFVLLDIDEKNGKYTREFIPIAGRRLFELPVDVSDCMHTFEIMERVDAKRKEEQIEPKDLVKVILTGDVDVACEIDVSFMLKRLEPEYYFVKIYDETLLKVHVEQYLLDQTLKGEFVRTVMGAEDLSEEDKASIVRYGLRAIAGEEVLECD